jgi:hypothetical protein
LFRPGASIKIRHVMQPLGPGDPEEARPAPATAPSRVPVSRASPVPAPTPGPAESPQRAETSEYGSLDVRVQPRDARVIVDGEAWESPDAGQIMLQLSDGTHAIEVQKEGYRTYKAELRVRRGETTSLNVSLSRE